MRAHGVVARDRPFDRVDHGRHEGKHSVHVEFVFENAVDPFGDRMLIAVILIGHTRQHAHGGELLQVVMATALTAAWCDRSRLTCQPTILREYRSVTRNRYTNVCVSRRQGISLTTTWRGAVTRVSFRRLGATTYPWCEYVVRVYRGFRWITRRVER